MTSRNSTGSATLAANVREALSQSQWSATRLPCRVQRGHDLFPIRAAVPPPRPTASGCACGGAPGDRPGSADGDVFDSPALSSAKIDPDVDPHIDSDS